MQTLAVKDATVSSLSCMIPSCAETYHVF